MTILVTAGDTPHAIPVSAAIRAGERRALLGLADVRGSVKRLRENPAVALVIICEGIAVTAHGRGQVVDECLIDGVVAVSVEIERVQDHYRPTFDILGGVNWRWADPVAASRDDQVKAKLKKLAGA